MYQGYFCIGGNEILNNTRTLDYALSAGCPVNWFVEPRCSGIAQVIGETRESGFFWDYENIEDAPWYDASAYYSRDFIGPYVISVEGLEDSTTVADSEQRLVSGSVIGRQRDGSRRMRFRVLLTALSGTGLDFGHDWLSAMLRETGCEFHSGSCGTTSLMAFTECFEESVFSDESSGVGGLLMEADVRTRYLHGVKTVVGPITQRALVSNVSPAVGRIVEFVLEAEQPRWLGIPIEQAESAAGRTIVQDAPFNLAPYPSAELQTATTVLLGENLMQNPSVEVNAFGITATSTPTAGSTPTGLTTNGRSTLIAGPGAGAASMQFRLLGIAGGSSVGGTVRLDLSQVATGMAALRTAGKRISATIWGRVGTALGTGMHLNSMSAVAEFLNGANVVVGSVTMGATSSDATMLAGRMFSARSMQIPATAVSLRVRLSLSFAWTSGPSAAVPTDVSLYADNFGALVP